MSGTSTDATLLRWFFALPEPLPFPDGWTATDRIANQPDEGGIGDPMVTVIFRQVSSKYGRNQGCLRAVLDITSKAPGISRNISEAADQSIDSRSLPTAYTVVEAITIRESPDCRPADYTGLAGDLPPRADPLNRCLRFVNDLARAYRLTYKTPYGLPTYERIPPPVLLYSAPAHRELVLSNEGGDGDEWIEQIRSVGPWSGPSMVLLDHLNTSDIVSGPIMSGDQEGEFIHWMSEIRRGVLLIPWRERLIEADRALHIYGEYAQAVTLTQTACEVFLDSLLLLLLWEERIDASSAAEIFGEGKLVQRIKREWQPRLGGNWAITGNGFIAQWYDQTARLRNRVVHAGYVPSRLEAESALSAAFALERFTFGRLVEKRNRYPRTTLMTVAQSGLERRGLWRGRIKDFAEQVALTEPDWRQQLRAYRRDVSLAIT